MWSKLSCQRKGIYESTLKPRKIRTFSIQLPLLPIRVVNALVNVCFGFSSGGVGGGGVEII